MMPSVFMLAVLIVYLPNQGNFPTTLGIMGVNVFNILFAITVVAMLVQAAPREPRNRQSPPFTRLLIVYYVVLALALVIALFRGSPHPVEDVVIFKNLISYSLLYFLAYYGVRDLSQIRFLTGLIVVVFAAAAIEAIIQGISYGLHDFSDENRASGPFGEGAGNSNFAGIFYAIFATFALSIALLGKQLRFSWRMLALAAYGIGCLAIIATFSRQAFLVIAITTFLLAMRRNPLIAIGVVAFLLAYPLWAPQGVIERIEMTQRTTTSGQEVLESSAASRYELWDGAIQIVKRNPAGIGLNQFQHEVEPYLPEWIIARDAQNQYLRFAAETGIQGLLVFIILLSAFARLGLWVRRLREPPDAFPLGTAFLVSTIAVALGNIFSSTFAFGEIMANFWILAGFTAKYYVLASAGTEQTPQETQPPLERMRQVYARWNEERHESEARQ